MNTLRTILAATDFSPASTAALAQAARLAAATGAALHVIHVVPSQRLTDWSSLMPDHQQTVVRHLEDDACAQLDAELADLGMPDTVEAHVVTGNVVHEILIAVARLEADLLVLGSNGSAGAPDLGTIAVRCVRKAPTRVLLVPTGVEGRFERVLACLDFSELTPQILTQAFRVARVDDSQVTVVHVFQPPWERVRWGIPPENASELELQMRSLLRSRLREVTNEQADESAGVDLTFELVESHDHAEGIAQYARDVDTDLVVVGTTGRGALAYMMLGTTAEKVLRHVGCAVLAVKGQRSAEFSPGPFSA